MGHNQSSSADTTQQPQQQLEQKIPQLQKQKCQDPTTSDAYKAVKILNL